MATTAEHLTDLLDLKDEELAKAQAKIDRLERELEGSLDGWRREEELKDEGLPLPRLELVYRQRRGWNEYAVIYRLVYRHLLGHIVGHPLSQTKISGGSVRPVDLPFRDGAHAAHDSIHMDLPCFRIMPDAKPELLTFYGYDGAKADGKKHRRQRVVAVGESNS